MRQNYGFGQFLRYSLLNVLGMLGLSCYILADTFFVADGLGAVGLAALNIAIPVYSLVHGSGLMLGIGGATRFAVWLSKDNSAAADRVFTGTVLLAVILSIFFVLVGLLGAEQLTVWLGSDAEVFAMAHIYLKVILIFAPAFLLNDMLLCFVRNDGNPRLVMLAMLVGSVANIVLDYIFIFPLAMGIFGAVLATGLAPLVSLGVLTLHWLCWRSRIKLSFVRPLDWAFHQTCSLGFPSLVTEVAAGIVIIMFNFIILRLCGNIGVAAYGIVANLSLVMTAVFTGIAQGIQPLVSLAHGCGDTGGSRRILAYAMSMMLIIALVVYAGVLGFANEIVFLFNSEQNQKLQEIAVNGLQLYFTAFPFVGFNIIMAMYFTSVETALPAQLISLLRGMLIIIPAAFILADLWGLNGVWLSFLAAESLVSLIGIGFYRRWSGIYR